LFGTQERAALRRAEPAINLDELPYRVRRQGEQGAVRAYFEMLSEADISENDDILKYDIVQFMGSTWSLSLFWDNWIRDLLHRRHTTRKLMVEGDRRIQGFINLGKDEEVLEIAPWNLTPEAKEYVFRYFGERCLDKAYSNSVIGAVNFSQPTYRGIGRVLVARMVAERLSEKPDDDIEIEPIYEAMEFYKKLGFKCVTTKDEDISPPRISPLDARNLICSAIESGSSFKIKGFSLMGQFAERSEG
jgi:hypothetical protein